MATISSETASTVFVAPNVARMQTEVPSGEAANFRARTLASPSRILAGRVQAVVVAPSPMLAVAAVLDGAVLRVSFGGNLDILYIPTSDVSRYAVFSQAGSQLEVAGIAIGADGHSVELTLSDRPGLGEYRVEVAAGTAKSTSGVVSEAATLTFSGTDRIPPTIKDFSPSPGTPIRPSEAIAFSVTDESELRRILVLVQFGDGRSEMVYDGSGFKNIYDGTVSPIEGGYRFSVFRKVGWPSGPTFKVFAVDVEGNEAG